MPRLSGLLFSSTMFASLHRYGLGRGSFRRRSNIFKPVIGERVVLLDGHRHEMRIVSLMTHAITPPIGPLLIAAATRYSRAPLTYFLHFNRKAIT